MPQQIHLATTSDDLTRSVSWMTMDPTTESLVHYGLSPTSLDKTLIGSSMTFLSGLIPLRETFIHNAIFPLGTLKPNTTYFYSVGEDEGGWSPIKSFKMMDMSSPIRIALFGDFGVVNDESLNLLLALNKKDDFDMVIHVGDFAYNMDDDNGKLGDDFMNQIAPISSNVPYMTCLGNHEHNQNFSHYTNRFSLISETTPSGNNWYYSFDISTVHFVALSTEIYYDIENYSLLKQQYDWLSNDLSSVDRNKTPWVVVFGHRPLYCSNVDDLPDCTTDAQLLRQGIPSLGFSMDDLLMKYNVDVYFTAHEHSYERSYPVYNESFDPQQNHTYFNAKYPTHILTGSAGCDEQLDYYSNVTYGPWSVVRSSSYGIGTLVIHNSTHLYWKQYLNEGLDGIDYLWLTKDDQHTHRPFSAIEEISPSSITKQCHKYCMSVCLQYQNMNTCKNDCHCQDKTEKELEHAGVGKADIRLEKGRNPHRHQKI